MGNTNSSTVRQVHDMAAITTINEFAFKRTGAMHSISIQAKSNFPRFLNVILLNDKEEVYRFEMKYDSENEYYSIKDGSKKPNNELFNDAFLEESLIELSFTFNAVLNTVKIRCNHKSCESDITFKGNSLPFVNVLRIEYDNMRLYLTSVVRVLNGTNADLGDFPVRELKSNHESKHGSNFYYVSQLYQKADPQHLLFHHHQQQLQQQQSQVIQRSRQQVTISLNSTNSSSTSSVAMPYLPPFNFPQKPVNSTSYLFPTRESRFEYSLKICHLTKLSSLEECTKAAQELNLKVDAYDARFLILTSDKQVTIAFRATSTKDDIIKDLTVKPVEIQDGVAIHSGFLQRALELESQFPNWRESLSEDKELFVVGHSLGGSSAVT